MVVSLAIGLINLILLCIKAIKNDGKIDKEEQKEIEDQLKYLQKTIEGEKERNENDNSGNEGKSE